MDSKLVVEQMSGRWKVKHPDLAVLHQQATALSTRFDHITYTWIPRSEEQRTLIGWPTRRWTRPLRSKRRPKRRRPRKRLVPSGLDRCARCSDPVPAAAPRADRIVDAAAIFGPRQPGADRCRSPTGRCGCAVSGGQRRHRRRDHLTAAARVRHRGGGGQGARAGCHRRRRPDRNRLRVLGGADFRRGGRTRSGAAPALVARHQRQHRRRGELRRRRRSCAAGARRGSSPNTAARRCWWCRT